MQERKLVPVEQLSSEYKNINKWAVIVGISEYKHKPWKLNYAHRDAEELFKLLQTKTGGDFKKENIAYLIDKQATTTNIRIALFDFLQKPAKEDLVFIFFACHGTPDPSRPQNLYLLTYDTDPESIPGTGLPMEDIYRSLNNTLLAEKIIVMADTCHSGGLSQNATRSIEDDSELLNQYFENLSQSVGGVASLTSAEAREVSREGEQWGGGHGVFTHHVLEGMKGAADTDDDGIVTVGELFEYVREKVKRDTDHRQHPSIGSGGFDRNLPISIADINITSQIAKQQATKLSKKQQIYFSTPTISSKITRRRVLKIAGLAGTGIGISVLVDKGLKILTEPPSPPVLSEFKFDLITVDKAGNRINSESKTAEVFSEKLAKGVNLKMVLIPEGEFFMGTEEAEIERLSEIAQRKNDWGGFQREKPRHKVTIKPFCIGKYPITQKQWQAVMGYNPSAFKDYQYSQLLPVEQVTWHQAVDFCDKLTKKTKKKYRLPSEAEWEYACRAGTNTPFYFGETIKGYFANYQATHTYANEKELHYRQRTTVVGNFNYPNGFGLYDLHGNVWEWCQDNWRENYSIEPLEFKDGRPWLKGSGDKKVRRGGSWDNYPEHCRSAFRNDFDSNGTHKSIGFRVVCDMPQTI
ncbi:MAG: SUMF1/EgtB/PvdO family nonheme iron enzyme [Cyanobacteria bacterium P01_G01_bin.39]